MPHARGRHRDENNELTQKEMKTETAGCSERHFLESDENCTIVLIMGVRDHVSFPEIFILEQALAIQEVAVFDLCLLANFSPKAPPLTTQPHDLRSHDTNA